MISQNTNPTPFQPIVVSLGKIRYPLPTVKDLRLA